MFTDRGVYRLGEEVHLKAILRSDTPTGVTLLAPGTLVDVSTRDSQSKEIDKRTVKVGDWSSAEWTLTLPADGALGNYQITAKRQDASSKPDNDREAVRNLELASQAESGSYELWRLMATGYARLDNHGMTSLARAEMAIIRGQRAEAQAHAAAAERQLQAGTPAWQRAQDIKAYISSRPKK